MRNAFITQLIEEARKDEKIFLIVGDLGFSVVEPFQNEFPDRFLNAGIAEQNMTGIATGLAKEGYTVFTYSIGNFPTLRCMEQIRYDVCYHEANVKIIAVGGGFAYGPLGTSHHATEELGMLRVIPNLTVCAAGDPMEAKRITSMFVHKTGPCYLRLGKSVEAVVHQSLQNFEWGKMICVQKGVDTALLASGSILKYAYDWISGARNGWGLYSAPFLKPMDFDSLTYIANHFDKMITIEEHQKSGGFGSAVLEGLSDLVEQKKIEKIPNLKRIAIPDRFYNVAGDQEYLRNLSNLVIES